MTIKASLWAIAALAIGTTAIPAVAFAQDTIHATRGASQVYIQTSTELTTYTVDSVTAVAVMSDIEIPDNGPAMMVATFSAESNCVSTTGSVADCIVKIICDGLELYPRDTFGDFVFDSSRGGALNITMIRHSEFVAAGTHTCAVLAGSDGAVHHIDDWTFTVKVWRDSFL